MASISRLLNIIGFFCKRALSNRLYSAIESYDLKRPTNRSHPIGGSPAVSRVRYTHFFYIFSSTPPWVQRVSLQNALYVGLICQMRPTYDKWDLHMWISLQNAPWCTRIFGRWTITQYVLSESIHIKTHTYLQIYAYMDTCKYEYVHKYIYIQTFLYINMYIYIYIYQTCARVKCAFVPFQINTKKTHTLSTGAVRQSRNPVRAFFEGQTRALPRVAQKWRGPVHCTITSSGPEPGKLWGGRGAANSAAGGGGYAVCWSVQIGVPAGRHEHSSCRGVGGSYSRLAYSERAGDGYDSVAHRAGCAACAMPAYFGHLSHCWCGVGVAVLAPMSSSSWRAKNARAASCVCACIACVSYTDESCPIYIIL